MCYFFFCKQKTAYEMRISDWSSDVCSSDLPNSEPAVNYGGIGAVIGHELSHHFDDQGAKYDKTGTLTDWWTPQDVQNFEALTGKLAAQYDAYEPLPGQHVKGKLTLGENIADLAGLTVSYDAYKLALYGKRSEDHTSELQSLMRISYAVFFFIKNYFIKKKAKNEK